jgi:2-polyprenyl-3-methyl-5-hydroxy-6-metoxy-1,4-benzoquinol methylase
MNSFCQLCNSTNLHTHPQNDAKSKSPLAISFCSNCSLVQQAEIPSDEELKIYYSHNYRQDYKSTYSPKPKYVRRAGMTALDRIKFLESHLPLSNQVLLDIGAGGGEFVYMAQKRGLQSKGIEPNLGYSTFSKEQYGVEVKTAMLSDVQDSSADIVTLFHVFEHMAKPLEVMKKLYSSIKDGGYLFIEVPNILQADASPHNIYFKAHLFYYSKYTLACAASQYFDVVKVEDKGNLKVLFKKKAQPSENISSVQIDQIDFSQNRIKQKGWFEYLFNGKGLLKPFLRIDRVVTELFIKQSAPKEILDSLYASREDFSRPLSKHKLKRTAAWSSAGGLGFIAIEAFC